MRLHEYLLLGASVAICVDARVLIAEQVDAVMAENVDALIAQDGSALNDVSFDPIDAMERQLYSRSLPPCKVLYGESFETNATAQVIANARYSLSHTVKYTSIGWKHQICNHWQVLCMSLAGGIDWDGNSGQIGTILGHWYGEDGSELLAVHYWHNELGFTGRNAGAKIYPAHGCIFICVKGYMNAKVMYSGYRDRHGNQRGVIGNDTALTGLDPKGNPRDPDGWDGPCRCYGNQRWDIFGSDIAFEWRKG
ncbi:hypothetical protein CKM354_000865300 [Cercospora kikuchii]|uniref:Uncharacterized protein n=1 Tax=Cercospora kikuchii TaxID=84275 RepID=A0A9P3CTK6_9PEZI|nr:uncharacterized protein CKM354_000865300 [Cercospora kikuchii]GIZ45490.1 hypothetical protein CKM354_000865300 [Cercospora kikuchii]